MPILQRVLSRFGYTKAEVPIINDNDGNRPSITIIGGWSGNGIQAAYDYGTFARKGYQLNSDVYACVSLIAQAAKSIVWDKAKSSKSMRLLEAAPGGAIGFVESWISYLLIGGTAYIELIQGETQNSVARIYLDQPDLVRAKTINYDTGRPVVIDWQVRTSMVPRTVPADRIVQSKLFNPLDMIYGMSPMQAIWLKVQSQNSASKHMDWALTRGFGPGWVAPTEEARRETWDENKVSALMRRIHTSRNENADLWLQGAEFHPFEGIDEGGSGAGQTLELTKRDIASAYHVPPELIGDSTTKTYSNVQEARQALYTEAVLPVVEQFRQDWNRSIGERVGDFLVYDEDTLNAIQGVRAMNAERVRGLFKDGVIDQPEARAELKYPEPRRDQVFYAPANQVPLGSVDES